MATKCDESAIVIRDNGKIKNKITHGANSFA